MRYMVGFYVLFLIGCSAGSSTSGEDSSKSLFSVWTGMSTGFVLDLTNGAIGTTLPITFITTLGAKCMCDLDAIGTQTSGNYVLSSCVYTTGGPGDPGCPMLDEAGNYTKPESILTLCSGGSCESYN